MQGGYFPFIGHTMFVSYVQNDCGRYKAKTIWKSINLEIISFKFDSILIVMYAKFFST